MTAAYRAGPKFRIGGFLDYLVGEKGSAGLKSGEAVPTFGAFAAYSDPNNRGFQAKFSATYNSGKVSITRANTIATEAGSGSADLSNYGVGAELGWGIPVSSIAVATPYLGIRRSDVTRSGYTEATVADAVAFPISYGTQYQRLTTATAGVRLNGMVNQRVGFHVSLGGEYDLTHKASTMSGTSAIAGLESFELANSGSSNRARLVASSGLFYQLDKTQRLTTNVGVREQAFSSHPAISTLLGYQKAF